MFLNVGVGFPDEEEEEEVPVYLTTFIFPKCPPRRRRTVPEATSQIKIDLSPPHEANVALSDALRREMYVWRGGGNEGKRSKWKK